MTITKADAADLREGRIYIRIQAVRISNTYLIN